MMNIWHDLSPERVKETDFDAVIEITKGGKAKYELDKETGFLKLDRVLYTSTHYPASYGFIPRTYAEDGDPLDVLVLCSEHIVPLALVRCYPIGVIRMTAVKKTKKSLQFLLTTQLTTLIKILMNFQNIFLTKCHTSSQYTKN